MSFPPKTPSKVAPGMSMPVVAGEEYTLKDDRGEALVLEGRDDPLTIAFIHAYDEWAHLLTRYANLEVEVAAKHRLTLAFEALPNRIKDRLPSRRAGIVVPGGRL